jgi:hypothetical protein
MDAFTDPVVSLSRAWSPTLVRVPVKTIVFQQAMAENGEGDRPRPLGPAMPSGHVRYRQ